MKGSQITVNINIKIIRLARQPGESTNPSDCPKWPFDIMQVSTPSSLFSLARTFLSSSFLSFSFFTTLYIGKLRRHIQSDVWRWPSLGLPLCLGPLCMSLQPLLLLQLLLLPLFLSILSRSSTPLSTNLQKKKNRES